MVSISFSSRQAQKQLIMKGECSVRQEMQDTLFKALQWKL